MQHSFPEKFIEQKLADTRREIEHNQLVRESKGGNSSLQAWMVNKMHDLSVWMICTGERLHERYHTTHFQHLHQRST